MKRHDSADANSSAGWRDRQRSSRPCPARAAARPSRRRRTGRARIKFAVIGIDHSHIYSQVEAVQRGGGELVAVYAKEPELADAFLKPNPAKRARKRERDSGGRLRSSSF